MNEANNSVVLESRGFTVLVLQLLGQDSQCRHGHYSIPNDGFGMWGIRTKDWALQFAVTMENHLQAAFVGVSSQESFAYDWHDLSTCTWRGTTVNPWSPTREPTPRRVCQQSRWAGIRSKIYRNNGVMQQMQRVYFTAALVLLGNEISSVRMEYVVVLA